MKKKKGEDCVLPYVLDPSTRSLKLAAQDDADVVIPSSERSERRRGIQHT